MSGLGAYAKLLDDALKELQEKQPCQRDCCRRCRLGCGAEGPHKPSTIINVHVSVSDTDATQTKAK